MKKIISYYAYCLIGCLVYLFLSAPVVADPDGPGRVRPQSGRIKANTGVPPSVYTIAMTTQYIKQEMAKLNGVGLSIALVNEKGVIWESGFGWADKENNIPATSESVYMIGSVSKFLTAVNLARLHEQEIINLDVSATAYLPELRMTDRYPGTFDQVTVRRLLNHHSGIPGDIYQAGFLVGQGWDSYGCDLYMNWLFDYLKNDYPTQPPGKIGVYSNTGFVLAGEIALRADGMAGEAYPSYLDRVLLSPLGMTHSSLHTIHENLARGYRGGVKQPLRETNCSFGATGGVYSTVGDMAKLIAMILNQGRDLSGRQFLKPETVAMLGKAEKSSLDIDSFFTPGLGLDTISDPGLSYAGRAWGKSGGLTGYVAYTAILPDAKMGAVVLTNSEAGNTLAWSAVRTCLQNALFESMGLIPSLPEFPVYASVNDPAAIAGTYVKKNGFDTISNNGDGTLTWNINAHTGAPDPFILSYNGIDFRSPKRKEALSFTTLPYEGGNPFVMIQSGSNGSARDKYVYWGGVQTILGEKKSFPQVSEAWNLRQGLYAIDNLPWDDVDWEFPFRLLSEANGILVLNSENILYPENDDLAWVVGLNNRADSSVRAIVHGGKEKLMFGGHRYSSLGNVTAITPGQTVSGTVDLFKSDWYRFNAPNPGQMLTVSIPDGSAYQLNLYNQKFERVASARENISWVVPEAGSYLISISWAPASTETYSLTLTADPVLEAGPDLQTLLKNAVSDEGVPGVVMSVSNPNGSWTGAAGKADLATGRAMGVDTQVRIASITKVFTATLIMQLVEEGLISLEDSMESLLPGVLPVYGDKITLRMLLNHTNGMPDHVNTPEWEEILSQDPLAVWSSADVVNILKKHKDEFIPPGQVYKYNNTGFYLLGMIAEAVTGNTVEQETEKRLFKPLGMRGTSLTRDSTRAEPYSRNYTFIGGQLTDTSGWNLSWDWTAGSAVTIAADMLKWSKGFFGGQVVSTETLEKMTTPFTPATEYGLGLELKQGVRNFFGEKGISHSGAFEGIYAVWYYFPESGKTIFVALNQLELSQNSFVDTTGIMMSILSGAKDLL